MGFDYVLNFDLEGLKKKKGLEPGGRVEQVMAKELLRLSEPYVPFDEGHLRDSGRIENGNEVVWGGSQVLYARRLYYHPEYNFQGAPRRGGMWVDRMLQDGGMRQIRDAIRKEMEK